MIYSLNGRNITVDIRGQVASPSNLTLMYDGDDQVTYNGRTSNDNYPDVIDNHGRDGMNMVFADGHAEWIPTVKYPVVWAYGSDEPSYTWVTY